eukprot:scaffold20912_cov126-Isochrysis_galbana.AAC.3
MGLLCRRARSFGATFHDSQRLFVAARAHCMVAVCLDSVVRPVCHRECIVYVTWCACVCWCSCHKAIPAL